MVRWWCYAPGHQTHIYWSNDDDDDNHHVYEQWYGGVVMMMLYSLHEISSIVWQASWTLCIHCCIVYVRMYAYMHDVDTQSLSTQQQHGEF